MTRKLCADFDGAAIEYLNGSKSFSGEFDAKVYGANSVKNALRKEQYDKCCFCESKVTQISYGDVEHFRPKAGYRQRRKDPLGRPGYYWLAYEWSNLLFCCQLCNQRFKQNLFPLVDPSRRALTHRDDLSLEGPLLLHPRHEDPAEFLGFHEEYLIAIDGNVRGETTLSVLGLNREELAEVRRDELKKLKKLIKARIQIGREIEDHPSSEGVALLAELDDHFRELVQDSAQFAAMTKAALRAAGLLSVDSQ